MHKVNYVDTNVLLDYAENILEDFKNREEELLVIPMVVLEELDNLKTKGGELGYKARRAVRAIKNAVGSEWLKIVYNAGIEGMRIHNDNKIIAYAKKYNTFAKENYDVVVLITNDINMELKAKAVFKDLDNSEQTYSTSNYYISTEKYKGWKLIKDDKEFNKVFTAQNCGNEYEKGTFAITDENVSPDSVYRYNGRMFVKVPYIKFSSKVMGTIKPKDSYQLAAMHSLMNDEFTALVGPAGTGKTLLCLGYAFEAISRKKYNKLIVAVNPIKARGVADLGFYKGSKLNKLMEGSIGAILKSKLGSESAVSSLIQNGMLEVTTIADCRGRQINKGEILYIPEAQNLTIDTTKLMIQRVEEGAKLILDGDYQAQVDSNLYSGENNGLARAIEVFKPFDFFGTIYLPIIYRSKLANIAELM